MKTNKEIMMEGSELLDRLIRKEKTHSKITVKPMTVTRNLTGRRVTVTSDLREASIIFFDFWPPETVKANWDDLLQWVERRP